MPSFNYVGSECSGETQPGARALRDAILARPEYDAAYSLGIYLCRDSSGGGGSLSLHAEGRAWDCGFPGECHPQGHALAAFLIAHADYLGVQRVIFCRREWGGLDARGRFEDFWEPYSGLSAHTDHLHIELNWEAALSLTVAKVNTLFGEEVTIVTGDRIDVFVRGSDGALWHKWYEGGWRPWASLGGEIKEGTAPAVIPWKGGLAVFVAGTDGQLWSMRWDGADWSPWEALEGVLTSGPAAVGR
jgi:hypothetical protein